jgi:hypothetical protein
VRVRPHSKEKAVRYHLAIFASHPLPDVFRMYAKSAFHVAGCFLNTHRGQESERRSREHVEEIDKTEHWVLWWEPSSPDDEPALPKAGELIRAADPTI